MFLTYPASPASNAPSPLTVTPASLLSGRCGGNGKNHRHRYIITVTFITVTVDITVTAPAKQNAGVTTSLVMPECRKTRSERDYVFHISGISCRLVTVP